MNNKFKRWLCLATILFLITELTTSVKGEPYIDYTDTLSIDKKISIINHLQTVDIAYKGNIDERGLINSLSTNTRLALWNDFANKTQLVQFSVNELRPYALSLSYNIKSFNDNFSKDGDGYISQSLNNYEVNDNSTRDELGNISSIALKEIIEEGSMHIDKVYSSLLSDYNSLGSDDEKKNYLGTKTAIIKSLYLYSERIVQDYDEIQQICGNDAADNGVLYKTNLRRITSLLTDSRYEPFIKYARELIEKDILSNVEAKLTDGQTAFQKLTAEQDYDGGKKNLINTVYWMMFSCSSSYRPFESTVGEDTFMYSLGKLVGEDNKVDGSGNGTTVTLGECSKLYSDIKSKKKPLYKRELTSSGGAKGTAERITVKDFLDQLKDQDSSGALVTVYGKFKRSQDTNTWSVFTEDGKSEVYNTNGANADNSINTNEANKENKDDENKDKEDKDNNKSIDSSNTNSNTTLMEDKDGNEFSLDSKITNEELLTNPVFTWGESEPRAVVNKAMMYNILKDDKASEGIDSLDKRFLYINPFGDLVLDDDTVIVPGASNATYYSDKKGTVYNPNTAAFMNSYPSVSLTTNYFTVDDRQNGKYIFGVESNLSDIVDKTDSIIGKLSIGIHDAISGGDEFAPKGVGQDTVGPTKESSNSTYCYIVGSNNETLKTLQTADLSMPVELCMYEGESVKTQTIRAKNYDFKTHILSGMGSGIRTSGIAMLVPDTSKLITYDQPTQIFPLTKSDDSGFEKRCETLSRRMFDTITTDEDGARNFLTGRINPVNLTAMFEAADGGNSNISAFVKNSSDSYSTDESSKVEKIFSNFTQKVLDTVGQTPGVIGIRNAYQDTIFGTFLYYGNKFFPYLAICVVLYFIIRLSRKRVNWIYGLSATCFALFVTVLFVQVIPVNLPIFLNGLINNISDNLGYRALFMREEKYLNPYETKPGYDSKGNFSLGTSSINLYRFKEADIPSFCVDEGVSYKDMLSGSAYVLDDNSGLFVQGDSIKINIDRLFAGISITGGYETNAVNNYYSVKSAKYVNDVMDYYTPYHLIIDGLLDKLNNLSELYSIPPTQLHYPNGIYKDSFLLDSYVKSDLVLNSDDLNKLSEQFSSDLVTKAKDMFGENNLDWLGLNKLLVKDVQSIPEVQETLWYKTMVREGYYSESTVGEINDVDLMAKLIRDTNTSVKDFLLNNESQMAYISDENLIKVTCLYALTEFNRIISSPTDMLYPQSLNYEELKLEDVMLPVLTKDYDRFVASDQKIVDYIKSDYGWIGLFLFSAIIVQSFIITNTMRFGLPILYILMLVCFIFRLAFKKQERATTACKGYFKIAGMIFICYCTCIVVTSGVAKINDSIWCMIILLVVDTLFVALISTVLTALILSPADFGSSKVNAIFSKLAKKLPFNNLFSDIGSAIFKKPQPEGNGLDLGGYKRIKLDRSVDDDFDEIVLDGVMRKRHGSTYVSNSNSKKDSYRRVQKGKSKKQYSKVIIDEDDEYDNSTDKFTKYKI